ncbi:hypothetical protein WS88_10845 [Burkholderia cepacia]|nr:hypothetical protein WS88_10845 [Burkholderia cepacia]KVL02280.1 hypothetical protein WS93_11555 [Burkholderia cepacia]
MRDIFHRSPSTRICSLHAPGPVEADTVAIMADEGAAELEDAMLSRVATKPSVTIVPPEDCPYLYDLRGFGWI